MDESKKKEFERTIETYADSFLKADNPRLIYEIAYSQVSMSHGRPKPAPKEVVLDDDTAAEVLFKLVAMADDPEKLDINNAMKEVYRTLGDPSMPYQQELDAAIHEKLPVIESKLKAAIEQQEIQHRMRTGADVSPEELYRHIASEPEIVSDALYGSKGKELLEFAMRQAESTVSKDNVTDFITAFNKNFEAIQTAFLDKAKAESAAQDVHHNPHVSKVESDDIARHAEAVAFSVSLLETSGFTADKAIVEKMQERPERFIEYTSNSETFADVRSKVTKTAKDKCREVISSINDRAFHDTSINLPAAVHFAEADVMSNSQEYKELPHFGRNIRCKSAACIKYFDEDTFRNLIKTSLGSDILTGAIEQEIFHGQGQLFTAIETARNTAIMNELTAVINERYDIDSVEKLSQTAFDKVFDAYLDIVAKSGYSDDILKTAAKEAVEAEHKIIESDIGTDKDITD